MTKHTAPRTIEHKLRLSESQRKHAIWLYDEELYKLWLSRCLPDAFSFKSIIAKHYPQFEDYDPTNMVKTFELMYERDMINMMRADEENRKREQIQKVMMFKSSYQRPEAIHVENTDVDYFELRRQQKKKQWWED